MAQYDTLSGIDEGFLVCSLLLVYVAYKGASIVHSIYLSPLSGIPGPWYAAFSEIYSSIVAARLVQCKTIHFLFKRYGPVVRIGPKKVVFCDRVAMKNVYCIHKLDKSTFYKALLADNHDHSMTSLSEVEHNMRRKMFAFHYTRSHIIKFQPHIHDCVGRLIEVLNANTHVSIDCMHTLRHFLFDISACTVFGINPIALNNLAHHMRDPVCDAVRDFFLRAITHSAIPSLIWSALAYLPLSRWQEVYCADKILASFVWKCLFVLRDELKHPGVDTTFHDEPTPLMLRMLLAQQLSGCRNGLSDQDIVSECISHLVAGVDTSAATFGFMLWELSRRPDIVQRLRDELDEVIDSQTIPDHTVLARKPYLNAFINEGFRMYGAVSALLERVVPDKDHSSASRILADSFDILGFQLPPGTIVGTQAWSMHRDPDVFPEPDLFCPERWLASENDVDQLARMFQHMMPFGTGTRACPGRYQALIVFQVTIAALVGNFELSANPLETNVDTMAPRDAFMVQPASRECRLTFTARVQ